MLHYSEGLEERIEADHIESYYHTSEAIDVRSRIMMRKLRCVDVTEERTTYLHDLYDLIHRLQLSVG